MTSEKGSRKDKNQNIQVFVRVRPLNQRERDIKSLGVIDVQSNREVVVRQSQQVSHTKRFTFDRAFGPNASQVEVYQEVVSPLIEEVLAGYNCTVFAYGQTGTGKTHTMVGENSSSGDDTNWQNDPLAGIIPRSLSQLFDELRLTNTEYTVRVSYLELYNEELFDLLSSSEDNSKLRIYEDVTRKGSNIVNGLEEITVYNKNEVYKIMSQGQERKKVASTLMNAQSSRSHTVFTIVVHMKENSPEGEELVKIGKLNLVDLAGSENISKAGSDNPAKRERARECVNINQSLLTLGRVITALVERHPHIPYRESKLTRILQESLGGRTKTSIIATISPGHKDLEETMSTLDYANRAKNIQNKPEINQKMTKKAILKEYAEEIDRLKRDLQAARDKNGIYLASDAYSEMLIKQEEQKKEIQDLLLKKRAMEEERDKAEAVFKELNQKLHQTDSELNNTRNKLLTTAEQLANTSNMLQQTAQQVEEQKYLVEEQRATESRLSSQARRLVAVCDAATAHVDKLHDAVDRRRTVESTNLEVRQTFVQQAALQRDLLLTAADDCVDLHKDLLQALHSHLDQHTDNVIQTQEQSKNILGDLLQRLAQDIIELNNYKKQTHGHLSDTTNKHRTQVLAALTDVADHTRSALGTVGRTVAAGVERAANVDLTGSVDNFVHHWYSGASDRVSSLRRSHATFDATIRGVEAKRTEAARLRTEARRAHLQRRETEIRAYIHEIEEEKALIEERLSKKLADIEQERQETELRLNAWMEEEKRIFCERISRHVESENKLLEDRIKKMMDEVESERRLFEERKTLRLQRQEKMLQESKQEFDMTEEDWQESESGKEMSLKEVTHYGKIFDEGASAIGTDMEVFSKNVVQVVDHISCEVKQGLMQTKDQLEDEVNNTVSAVIENTGRCSQETDSMLANMFSEAFRAVDTVVAQVESRTSETSGQLSGLSSAAVAVTSSCETLRSNHSARLEDVQHQLSRFQQTLHEVVGKQAELEEVYLQKEYKVYSPTGATPCRSTYRYPRQLAATSPLHRLLQRYRATGVRGDSLAENGTGESECEERNGRNSPTESDSSTDVVFVAPSPPIEGRAPIVKSTSETEIYRREQGKENNDRTRKRSKLPAPQSLKKPLVDSNGFQ